MSEVIDHDNDEELVHFANVKRNALALSPSQSNFKVYCILVVQVGEDSVLIHGTNGEQGYIGGAICAERAALVQLAHYKDPRIMKVIVTTDSDSPIAPGVQCREYLLSHAPPDTVVVMANGKGTRISHSTLQELYPCQYLYRYQRRMHMLCYAENFAKQIKSVTDDVCLGAAELFRRAMAALVHDNFTALHPVQLAAGVLYSNGDIEVTWMLKALEYGNTLDPVSQLVVGMERRRVQALDQDDSSSQKVAPVVLLQVDQFGVCHAPYAMARSILSEHNYGEVLCIVHDAFGDLAGHKASSLVPAPSGDFPLTHEDFLKMHDPE